MQHPLQIFIVLSLTLLGTSCGTNTPTANESPSNAVTATASTADAPTIEDTSTTIFFPQQAPPTSEQSFPTAKLTGTLLVRNDCLRVGREGGSEYLAIWPFDITLNADDDTPTIVDDTGQVMATVGQDITVGSGEVPLSIAAKYSPTMRQSSIPCEGLYRLASQVVQP